MIEVFKTNITDDLGAAQASAAVARKFPEYAVNFDLQDCDHVMRIISGEGVDSDSVISAIHACGFEVEVMSDEIPCIATAMAMNWE